MQYSYIVSHNLRAPIANLVGLSSFFQDTGHEKNNMIIQHIKESSERIDEILKDLNSILAIKEELNQSFEEISLLNIIDQVKSDLKNEIEDSDASINLNFDRIDKINSIRSFIHSIFYNLMSNSIKYRDKNKKCIIAINASINDGIITIKFSDNGIGIDLTKNKDKVFGLYKRFHKDVAEGTGVGLHLIKEQIESLGGNIKIESTLGEGTTFTIELNEIKYVKNPVD
jgi:light-regulated signal transduction histidine kinase (bacteriophytochrome)